MLDHTACVRAVTAKDARFDGVFFTGVTSTGIYCRPSCPALTPRPANMTFHRSSAAAQQAGFRACKRCRPDATPGSPAWAPRSDLTARAVRLITDGVVDREGVPGLARRLGYSTRQVERLLQEELGAGPLALARAQRAQTARVLVETTPVPLTDVAWAAGFSSVRSFNTTMQQIFGVPPREMRAARASRGGHPSYRPGSAELSHGMTVRLPFRPPLDPSNVLGHLAATGVPGVEEWRDGAYRRTLRLPHGPGIVALAPRSDHIEATFWLADLRDLAAAVARSRFALDLDADPVEIDAALAQDPHLAPLVAATRGRRVPHVLEPEEYAVRAVIGQQVSTAGARTVTGRFVAEVGEPVIDPAGGLTHLFPTMAAIAAYEGILNMPRTRQATLVRLAQAIVDGSVDLSPGADRGATRSALAALPGIGPWTVEMIAMRALGDPDAFPVADLGVKQAAARLGLPTVPRELEAASQPWRPWRAYAVQHLWATGAHPTNTLPTEEMP